MWMPALITRAPLALARSAAGISAPTGAKTIAPSSSSGGCSSEDPAHSAPSSRAKSWRLGVALAGEGEDPPALVDGDLAEDVSGGAEAVEPDPLGVADQAQRPVADQPGAEQRRRLHVRVALGDREAEALVGDRQLGVAAVDVVAGEAGAVAEVLAAAAAVAALAAGPAEPGDADPVADREALRALAPRPTTVPTIWWPGTSGSFGSVSSPSTMWRSVRQTPQAATEIRTWPGARLGVGQLDRPQRLALPLQDHRPHRLRARGAPGSPDRSVFPSSPAPGSGRGAGQPRSARRRRRWRSG